MLYAALYVTEKELNKTLNKLAKKPPWHTESQNTTMLDYFLSSDMLQISIIPYGLNAIYVIIQTNILLVSVIISNPNL